MISLPFAATLVATISLAYAHSRPPPPTAGSSPLLLKLTNLTRLIRPDRPQWRVATPSQVHSVSNLVLLHFMPSNKISNNTAPYDEPGSFMNPMQWAYPTYPTFSPESVRCGRDNLAWANATETLQVKPGDTIEWLILSPGLPPNTWDNSSLIQWDNCPGGKGACKGSKYVCDPHSHYYSVAAFHHCGG